MLIESIKREMKNLIALSFNAHFFALLFFFFFSFFISTAPPQMKYFDLPRTCFDFFVFPSWPRQIRSCAYCAFHSSVHPIKFPSILSLFANIHGHHNGITRIIFHFFLLFGFIQLFQRSSKRRRERTS